MRDSLDGYNAYVELNIADFPLETEEAVDKLWESLEAFGRDYPHAFPIFRIIPDYEL